MTKRVYEIEKTHRVLTVAEPDGFAPQVASYAAIELDEHYGTDSQGRKIHVARDGGNNTRVVLEPRI